MRRLLLGGGVFACVGALGVGYCYWSQSLSAAALDPTDYNNWSPRASEIRSAVQAERAKAPGTPEAKEAACRALFRKMFQDRFRQHDPPEAIGFRFRGPDEIKLMVPARMEPWNTDTIAEQAWRETRADLGRTFNVDLFATYIGMRPRQIGMLRPSKQNPKVATIEYFPHAHAPGMAP